MSIGFLMIRSYQDRLLRWLRGTVYAVPVVYPVALFLVFALSQE